MRILWPVLCVLWLTGHGALAQTDDVLTIRVEEGDTLRDLAAQHLGDPDLWTEILRANGLDAITDVHPGLELKIPAAQVLQADRALRDALDVIQQATEQGARLFAPDEIAEAIRLRDQGIAERQDGQWDQATRLADLSRVAASQALALAIEQRDAAAEALLTDRQGSVEGQRPQDLVWTDRALNDILIEEEKVRTLSRSTAQITFRDDSRLRLNANSQALIQRMRVDPLSREEEAKVSLIEGDFYALLAGKSQRNSFELEVPEVETQIDSTSFWVRRDDSGSKFTNYDEGVLQVSAQGESVDLGRNEATLVRSGAPPAAKIDVLPPPPLLAPQDDQVAFNAAVELAWSPVADAAGYWLEVAHDPGFRRMVQSRWGLTDVRYDPGPLDIGAYYWRVAALDKFGLPGERTDAWRFHVRTDVTAPYISIGGPQEGAILRESPIRVQGESEPGATLELNGEAVPIAPDGSFDLPYRPSPGLNTISIEARDAAGNTTERQRAFVFMPDQQAAVAFDQAIPRLAPRHFVTDREVISISGRTGANAAIVIQSSDGEERASSYADPDGRFGVNVPLQEAEERFSLQVVAPSGFVTGAEFQVTIDQEPPPIELEAPPPVVTAVEWLPLRGRLRGGGSLLIDGRPATLIDDTFEETITLRQGPNAIELVATDLVGNVSVEKFGVFLDQEPPQLVREVVSPGRASPGATLTVEVVASDASGMKQAAPFTLRVGDATLSDFLRFNPSSESYRSTLVLPEGMQGPVALKDVELEDYAGNRQRYTFR
ncbi:MAG: FecR domain-containing protein [Geminicoccaceae bacterium]